MYVSLDFAAGRDQCTQPGLSRRLYVYTDHAAGTVTLTQQSCMTLLTPAGVMRYP